LKTIGVIPIRAGSSRFPGKGLAMINGKPMVLHVFQRAKQFAGFERLVVATDDLRIKELIEPEGGEVFFSTREYRNGSERVADAVSRIDCEFCVDIQGDEIFVTPGMIESTLEVLKHDPEVVASTAVFPISNEADLRDRNLVKAVLDKKSHAIGFSRNPIPDPGNSVRNNWGHAGIYAYRKSFLMKYVALPPTKGEVEESLEQLRIVESGYKIGAVCLDRPVISINTPDDLIVASKVLKEEGGL
jgi:3-deoxy-manno-octulosonate cytidylyltransferase (CMP-KDO synthetase)